MAKVHKAVIHNVGSRGWKMASGMHRGGALAVAILVAISAPATVYGETLKEALTAAYLFNPTLKAARARLRVIDNGVPLAKSGYRPQIGAVFNGGYDATSATSNTASAITLQQNIFDGFQTYNNVKGAEALVEAGREDLQAVEQTVLVNAATAYVNTYRDQAIVNLLKNHLQVLTKQLEATRELYKAHQVSVTDVEQAKVALTQSQVNLSIAQGTVHGDQALFAQYIGHPPGILKDPGPPTRLLPKTLEEAIKIAQTENPGVIFAVFRERAQQHQVKQLKGQLLPNASLQSSYGKVLGEQGGDALVFGSVGVPIYEAGIVSSEIRQATEVLSRLRHQIDEQRELARQNVTSAWGLLLAAKGNIAAGQKAVEAAQNAIQDVRDEQKLGQRSVFDVLNAVRTSLVAQVNLVSFRHDLVVSSYSVLASMGRLTASDIALQAEVYDPTLYYGEVKDAWFGWGASIESKADPRVLAVEDAGRTPSQNSADGPAYTQTLPQIP